MEKKNSMAKLTAGGSHTKQQQQQQSSSSNVLIHHPLESHPLMPTNEKEESSFNDDNVVAASSSSTNVASGNNATNVTANCTQKIIRNESKRSSDNDNSCNITNPARRMISPVHEEEDRNKDDAYIPKEETLITTHIVPMKQEAPHVQLPTAATATTSCASKPSNNATTTMNRKQEQLHQLPRSIRWRLSLGLLTMPNTNNNDSSDSSSFASSSNLASKKSMSKLNDGTLPAKDLVFNSPGQFNPSTAISNNSNNSKDGEKETDSTSSSSSSLIQYIEDTNALKLRCQRSRYDELEQKHYYSNTLLGIADSSQHSDDSIEKQLNSVLPPTGAAVGGSEVATSPISSLVANNKMHHVAPGDDPLSALLGDSSSATAAAASQPNNKGIFGNFPKPKRNNMKKTSQTTPSMDKKSVDTDSSNNTNGNRRTSTGSLVSNDSAGGGGGGTENNEELACKGSRWADYYSTREVLDVIEKDLNRLPQDHYTIYHEWKQYNDDELIRNRLNGVGVTPPTTINSSDSSNPDAAPPPSVSASTKKSEGERKAGGNRRQSNKFGGSFKLNTSFNFGNNNNNSSNSKDPNNPNAVNIWSNLMSKEDTTTMNNDADTTPAASTEDHSRKERADRLSQLLFVYAREHPEIGYRQGMHEILSFILLALEMDILEQSVKRENDNWKRDIMEMRRSSNKGGMAGVDSSGQIVVVRLLDQNYLLHDAFALFECIMSALAPAYDAIPGGEEATSAILEKAKRERGESPMEAMTSCIVSKIRFVARDEALFSQVLCMPVPPQIYFAKWVRLMFGREVQGGMKHVMRLWDCFFDLASSIERREENVSISLALMNVLETAAASMIILIRDKLLKPSMAMDGTWTGEPDPNEGIAYLMNYPPIEDIDNLIKVISSLLLKEKSITQLYERQRSEDQEVESEIIGDPFLTGSGRMHDQNRPRQVAPLSPDTPDIIMAGKFQPVYNPEPKIDVAESIGNFVGGLLDVGSRTVDAAISTYQKHQAESRQRQNNAVNHPLQFGFNAPPHHVDDRTPHSNTADTTYAVTYRNHADSQPAKEQNTTVYSSGRRSSQTPKRVLSSSFTKTIKENEISDSNMASPSHKNVSSNGSASATSIGIDQLENGDTVRDQKDLRLSASLNIRDSIRKSPKELAQRLDKSVKTLMNHFEEQQRNMAEDVPNSVSGVIPVQIWEAMAQIESVKKELLMQDALDTLERSESSQGRMTRKS